MAKRGNRLAPYFSLIFPLGVFGGILALCFWRYDRYSYRRTLKLIGQMNQFVPSPVIVTRSNGTND